MYTPSFVFFRQPHWLLKTNFSPSSETRIKSSKKCLYYLNVFQTVFTCLERTSTFITSILRTIYRSSFPELFSIKGVLSCRYVAYLQKNTHAKVWFQYIWSHTFAWMFSCKLSKLFVRLSWKAPLSDCFCVYKSECCILLLAFTSSELKYKNHNMV